MTIKIHPINTKKDYENALALIDQLWDAKPNTEDGNVLEVLTILVEAYENKNFPIASPNPIEAIKFRMEQMQIGKAEIVHILGGANRVSEILHKNGN